jgi:rhamnulokinase
MSNSARRPARPPPIKLLEEAAKLSRRFGLDPGFTRGGGGNISVKADGVLYIKASGVALASLTADALIPLEMEPLLGLLGGASDDGAMAGSQTVMAVAMGARLQPTGEQRPSVEVLFHALIPRRFVLHTHPTIVNALCCAREGEGIAERLFGDAVLWVPYVDPGLPLARAISGARRKFEESTGATAPDILLLENHGLIVAADEPSAIPDASLGVVEAVRGHLEAQRIPGARKPRAPRPSAGARAELVNTLGPVLRGSLSSGSRLKVVAFDDSSHAVHLASTAEGRSLVLGGPVTPDQIVYAGSWPLWLDPWSVDSEEIVETVGAALLNHVHARGALPSIVVVDRLGLFAAGETVSQAETARDVYIDAIRIGFGALQLGGVRALAPAERRFIEDWEAQAYRRGVEAAGSTHGPGRGLVILVSGAATGLGPRLTAELSAGGVHVVPVDEQRGAAVIDGAVRNYGGFDVLVVNRTGPLIPAQPLTDLVDAALRVFALQRAGHPAYRGGVIEILPAHSGPATRGVSAPIGTRGEVSSSDCVAVTALHTESPAEVLHAVYEAISR